MGWTPSSGDMYASPDIIPFGDGTLGWSDANSTYSGPDQGKAIDSPGSNNIYIRAFNPSKTETHSGTVQLYYAPASLVLVPSQWVNNQVLTAAQQSSVALQNAQLGTDIGPQTVALAQPPFWLSGLDANIHYCLVCVVQTPLHSVTIPRSFASNAELVGWVLDNPGVAWRNLTIVAAYVPTNAYTAAFQNLDQSSHTYTFSLTGRGMTPGTVVHAQSTDPQCPIDWTGNLPFPDPIGNQGVSFTATVPAGYTGWLTITLTAPDTAGIPPSQMSVKLLQPVSPSPTELESRVARTFQVARPQDADELAVADEVMIELGEYTIEFAAPS